MAGVAQQHVQPIVPDAEWQAGLTPGHLSRRPYLNGEPVPGACAASSEHGWVAFWNDDVFVPVRYQRGAVEIRSTQGERC